MTLSIEIIPCLTDNYAYLLTDGEICAVVDPSEAAPVMAALGGRRLTHILNTHHHGDHTGGNADLKKTFGATVIGPEKDRARIPEIDIGVSEEKTFQLGKNIFSVLEVPAHTSGAIAFVIEKNVFTGDTLFSLGCGRLFEGTPEMMMTSLAKLMRLPDDTKIFCGHEYTLKNGKFALTLEPNNPALIARMKEIENLACTIPSSIGLEKMTNPFLRTNSNEIQKNLGLEGGSLISVFAKMRELKDVF